MLNITGKNTSTPPPHPGDGSPFGIVPHDESAAHPSKSSPLWKLATPVFGLLLFFELGLLSGCIPTNDASRLSIQPSNAASTAQSSEVGALSGTMTGAGQYNSLILELQPMGKSQISQEALNHVRAFLLSTLNWKSEQLRIIQNPALFNYADPESQDGRMTVQWARTIERRVRKSQALLNRGSIFVLVADSKSSDDTDTSRTFGLSHRSSSIILYHPTILDNSGTEDAPQRWRLEAAVLEHELGHLLGLVNSKRGSDPNPMDKDAGHESAESPTHCSTAGCLMHADTIEALKAARGTQVDGVPRLCGKCLELLQQSADPSS